MIEYESIARKFRHTYEPGRDASRHDSRIFCNTGMRKNRVLYNLITTTI